MIAIPIANVVVVVVITVVVVIINAVVFFDQQLVETGDLMEGRESLVIDGYIYAKCSSHGTGRPSCRVQIGLESLIFNYLSLLSIECCRKAE